MPPSRQAPNSMQRVGSGGVSRSDGVVGVRGVNKVGSTLHSPGWPYSNIYVTIPPLTASCVAQVERRKAKGESMSTSSASCVAECLNRAARAPYLAVAQGTPIPPPVPSLCIGLGARRLGGMLTPTTPAALQPPRPSSRAASRLSLAGSKACFSKPRLALGQEGSFRTYP